MTNLDEILKAAKSGDTITLKPTLYGISGSKGGVNNLPDGITLNGNGATILLRDESMDEVTALRGRDAALYNFTLICGTPPPGSTNKRNGIFIEAGTRNSAEEVNVLRTHGHWASDKTAKEGFAINLNGVGTVRDCNVADSLGDYVSAICAQWIENCSVDWPKNNGNPFAFFASFNIGNTKNGAVKGCTDTNATYSVYSDWYEVHDALIENNVFTACQFGLNLNAQIQPDIGFVRSYSGIEFRNNVVLLNPQGAKCQGVCIDHTTPDRSEATVGYVRDVQIHDNKFDFAPGDIVVPVGNRFVINVASLTPASKRSETLGVLGVKLTNNEANPTFAYRNFQGNADVSAIIYSKPNFVTQ